MYMRTNEEGLGQEFGRELLAQSEPTEATLVSITVIDENEKA
jgi:hypothetical protein